VIAYFLDKVNKVYGQRTVLCVDQLELVEGSIYGLLGANGAGKTTLLNMLAFLDQPHSGQLRFFGETVCFHKPLQMHSLRQQVTMLDQYPVLFTCSVYKNIEFGLKIRKKSAAEIERIVDEVLELVDMRSFKYAPAYKLSGGETQRIALARAVALSPRVFLCDEPTASVDVENQTVIIDILKRINLDSGITIVFTTHDRLLATALANKIIVLDKGQLATGCHENVFTCQISQLSSSVVRCTITDTVCFTINTCHPDAINNRCRVFIDPEKMSLSFGLNEPGGDNNFQGRIVQLLEEGNHIRVVVDVGILLSVFLDNLQYGNMRPGLGDTVTVFLDDDAARICVK
jgi:tungstate transport system ATP-binding protein